MVREGFDVQHPAQVRDVDTDGRTLSVLAPTRVDHRPRRHPEPADRHRDPVDPAGRRDQGADRAPRRGPRSRPAVRAAGRERAGSDHRDHRRRGRSDIGRADGSHRPRPGLVARIQCRWEGPHLQPAEDDRSGHRAGRCAVCLPTARAGRRGEDLRSGGAVRAGGQERPAGRHLAGRRRHQQRSGLQERAVLLVHQGLRSVRQPRRAGLLRDRLRSRFPQPVLGSRRAPGVSGHPRADAEADPGQVHRADRATTPGAGMVVRALALDLVHHRLRREDRQQLHRRHGRA